MTVGTKPVLEEAREVKGCCPMDCPDTCSWVVTVKGDQAIKLEGSKVHPITKGVLCTKMNRYLEYTRSPDRLLYPLRRIGKKGEGKFTRISWDDALAEISTRLEQVIGTYGAESIWPYYGCGSYGALQGLNGAGRRFFNVLGASVHQLTICTITGSVGTGYTLGENRVGMDPETIDLSKLIILWGTNTLSTNHHLWRRITEARANGAYLVVIDPIKTRTALQADEHIAIWPGTDAALALALLNVVISMGAEDKEFIAQHTAGWEEFRTRIQEYPPEVAASITGVAEEVIVALGKRLATSRPTAIKMQMGLTRHGGGGMAVRTITCIPGVTGDWRYPGGGAGYDTRGFFRGNWAALWRDDLRPQGTRSLYMTRLAEGLLEVNDPPVKALFVYAANPMVSSPNQTRIREGLLREDLFTVALEHFHTDTVDYADIVLPTTMQTEHADIHNTYGHIYIGWNEPAVPPLGECIASSEIFRKLAWRMGLKEPALYDTDEDMAKQLLDSDHPSLKGITLKRLKEEGFVRPNYPTPFAPFANGFPTLTGKLEFVSPRMKESGLDPIAGYTPPHEAAQRDTELAKRYPFALLTPAAHHFLNSMFSNVSYAQRSEGPPKVWINPKDADALGLTQGSRLRVFNDRGAFQGVAEISDRVRPGVVSALKGYWTKTPGVKGGSTVNAVVAERDSDMGHGAVFHDNRVAIEALPLEFA